MTKPKKYPHATILFRPNVWAEIESDMAAARASGMYTNVSAQQLRSIVIDGILRKHYRVEAAD